MCKLISTRISKAAITLFLSSILIFLAIEIIPGDMASIFLGRDASAEYLTFLREELGLNQSLFIRYIVWMQGLIQGEFGKSFLHNQQINQFAIYSLRNTIFLAATSTILCALLAAPLGIISALNKDNKLFHFIFTGLSFGISAIPEFYLATLFIFIFAVRLDWLHGFSTAPTDAPLYTLIGPAALPIITLAVVMLPPLTKLIRAKSFAVINSKFVLTAKLKGVPRGRLLWKHILPNVLLPIIPTMTLTAVRLLIVAVPIIERVFGYTGINNLTINAINDRNLILVRDSLFAIAAVIICLHLIVDLIWLWLNPHLRQKPVAYN